MLNRQKAKAQTAYDEDALQRQVAITDQQIDQLVYELYGISADEIRMVEKEIR